MKEILLCLLLIFLLFLLFTVFGKLILALFHMQMSGIPVILLGVFTYYGVFQLLVLPMIMLKQSLTRLTICWMIILACILCFAFSVLRRRSTAVSSIFHKDMFSSRIDEIKKHPFSGMLILCMLLVMFLQFYYVITSPYLGWDTSAYVGTISTAVERDCMYLFNGENNKAAHYIDFRYALSGFYMHSAVWCRILGIRALYIAKLVQGGICSILSGMLLYQSGLFLFSHKRYENHLNRIQTHAAASGVVIAATAVNVCFHSIYSSSDFLLSRGLEAKAYCANVVLPGIFLFGIMLWRDSERREHWLCMFMACFSSVALSMSALVTGPALATLMILPILLRKHNLPIFGRYLLCMLPNTCYLAIYVLYVLKIFRIGV